MGLLVLNGAIAVDVVILQILLHIHLQLIVNCVYKYADT